MRHSRTAQIAEPITGEKLYQQRARKILPLLVRQAEAGETITYSSLASEAGIPNARNLNYPLGSIGQTLENLSGEWKEKVPPIQCLVINKWTGLPGEGIGWFLVKKDDFRARPKSAQREIVKAELARIFAYPRWREVMEGLSLPYLRPDFSNLIREAINWRGGGEGPDHKRLKEFVAASPHSIGLSSGCSVGKTEVALPSGDSLDVSFDLADEWIAAEVKSRLSGLPDIVRGLFQCVKYRAVMDAVLASKGRLRGSRAVLVLEGSLPDQLIPLKNLLGVEVFEKVSPI